MSDKNQREEYTQRRELQSANWRVEQADKVEFNSGSESLEHFLTKCAAAWVLKERGYRIDSEVEMEDGEVDLLAYGREDGDKIVVECEQNATDDVVSDKIERYVYNQPIRECFILPVEDCPDNFTDAIEWVKNQL